MIFHDYDYDLIKSTYAMCQAFIHRQETIANGNTRLKPIPRKDIHALKEHLMIAINARCISKFLCDSKYKDLLRNIEMVCEDFLDESDARRYD